MFFFVSSSWSLCEFCFWLRFCEFVQLSLSFYACLLIDWISIVEQRLSFRLNYVFAAFHTLSPLPRTVFLNLDLSLRQTSFTLILENMSVSQKSKPIFSLNDAETNEKQNNTV